MFLCKLVMYNNDQLQSIFFANCSFTASCPLNPLYFAGSHSFFFVINILEIFQVVYKMHSLIITAVYQCGNR